MLSSAVDAAFEGMDWLCGRPVFPREQSGPFSVRADPSQAVWTHAKVGAGALATTPFPGCDTVYATFRYAVEKNASRPAVGQRALLKAEHVADPKDPSKSVEKLHLGEYSFITYAEMAARVDAFAAGLNAVFPLAKGTPVVIYAETKTDWMIAAQAVFRQNCSVVTIYATLGQDGVKYGVNQTEAPVVIADVKLMPCITSIAGDCPNVKALVTIGGEASAAQKAKLPSSVAVHAFDTLLADGKSGKAKAVAPVPPSASDVAVIMYTSGTTGAPKGVVIPHSAVCASMTGLKDAGRFTPDDVYLAYLPLAHIMEMAAECVMYAIGCSVGYGSPQTLTDSGLKLATGTRGDAPTLRPTFMVFAPTILDRVRSAVQAKVQAASPMAQSIFNTALEAAYAEFDAGRIGAPPLWNALAFRKVQALIGGRVTLMITGSAPLSRETQRFVQSVFNCPVRQGYGLTETCSAGTVGAFSDNNWSAGRVLTSCKVKLLDWDEGNYRVSDEKDPAIGMPRGEVLIGGPIVANGYYQNPSNPDPELTAKNASDFSVGPDGTRYFHTGDIGQMTADGMLQIIDRKKDLVKLQMGEYVALSKVENAMKQSNLVENALCYAESSKSNVVALVVPAVPTLRAWAKTAGRPDDEDWAALCKAPEAAKAVLASVQAACKGKLVPFEVPVAVALVDDPWTPENDCVTAAMKLKRQIITKKHKDLITAIYK